MLFLSHVGFRCFCWNCTVQSGRLQLYIVIMSVRYIFPVTVCSMSAQNILSWTYILCRKISSQSVCVLHVPSYYQIVDIFTKWLLQILFDDFRNSLIIREPPASTRLDTSANESNRCEQYYDHIFLEFINTRSVQIRIKISTLCSDSTRVPI